MPATTLLPLTILESSGKRRLVLLIGSTLPRQGRASILGTKQRIKVNRYIGNTSAKPQVLGAEWLPIRFGGILDDRRIGGKGTAAAQAYALEEINLGGRECTFTYGPFIRRVIVKKVVLQPLQLSMIRYSVELEVLDDGQGAIQQIRDAIRSIPHLDKLIALGGVALAAFDRFGSDGTEDLDRAAQTDLSLAKTSMGEVISKASAAQVHLDFVGEPGELVNSPSAQRALTDIEVARTETQNALVYTRRISWREDPGVNAFDAIMTKGRDVHTAQAEVMRTAEEVLSVRRKVSKLAGKTADGAVYIAKQGDTLRGIAGRFYNSPDKWNDIYTANGLTCPTLEGGEQLILADIPTPDVVVVR